VNLVDPSLVITLSVVDGREGIAVGVEGDVPNHAGEIDTELLRSIRGANGDEP
jgi:hypothetical protein